jgi:hypothetical protein
MRLVLESVLLASLLVACANGRPSHAEPNVTVVGTVRDYQNPDLLT